jgi:hypothetical protein
MSLINDALKRAKQAQQENPAPPRTGPALRPAEPMRRKQSSFEILLPIMLVALVGVGGLVIWFTMGAGARPSPTAVAQLKPASTSASAATKPPLPPLTPKAPPQTAPQTSTVKDATTSSVTRPLQPTSKSAIAQPFAPPAGSAPSGRVPETAPSPSISQPNPATVAATISPTPVSAPVPGSAAPAATITQAVVFASGPPPPPPLPKLQGIFYRPERPAALLDGRMVLVGRTSGGYHVVAISQQCVTVARAGQTNVLSMLE